CAGASPSVWRRVEQHAGLGSAAAAAGRVRRRVPAGSGLVCPRLAVRGRHAASRPHGLRHLGPAPPDAAALLPLRLERDPRRPRAVEARRPPVRVGPSSRSRPRRRLPPLLHLVRHRLWRALSNHLVALVPLARRPYPAHRQQQCVARSRQRHLDTATTASSRRRRPSRSRHPCAVPLAQARRRQASPGAQVDRGRGRCARAAQGRVGGRRAAHRVGGGGGEDRDATHGRPVQGTVLSAQGQGEDQELDREQPHAGLDQGRQASRSTPTPAVPRDGRRRPPLAPHRRRPRPQAHRLVPRRPDARPASDRRQLLPTREEAQAPARGRPRRSGRRGLVRLRVGARERVGHAGAHERGLDGRRYAGEPERAGRGDARAARSDARACARGRHPGRGGGGRGRVIRGGLAFV
ncbi:uncharacterized protein RHOBADRAFT_51342, partial [Rhodotorula graminis WP1]